MVCHVLICKPPEGGRGQVGSHVVSQVDALQKRGNVQPLFRHGDCGRLHLINPHTRDETWTHGAHLCAQVVFIPLASRARVLSGVI